MSRPERDTKRGLLGRVASGASERMLDIVDPNILLDHVDVEALLDRIDVNTLLERVDVNRLLDRVDIDSLLERADVEALVRRAGIPEIVAESTGQLTLSALDLFRRPLVGLDEIAFRGANRIFRRDPSAFPTGPGDLLDWVEEHMDQKPGVRTGRYAGPLTRLLAVMVDSFIVTFGLTLLAAGAVFVIRLFAPEFEIPEGSGVFYGVGLYVGAFLYLWASYAIFGKTVGKMVLGVRVVSSDGHIVLKGSQPFLRVLTYPLSFLLFGIGLLGVVFNPQRQAWHDRFAKTAVVYDWGSRTATMPTPLADFLARKGAEV